MIRTKILFLTAALSVAVAAPHLMAQDAAAPIRRGSPSPDEQPASEESAPPAPTAAPETPAPTAKPTPAPPEPASTPTKAEAQENAAAPSPEPTRRVIQEKPVRAMETRPSSARRTEDSDRPAPAARPSLPPASRPTFDLSETGGGYVGATIRSLENRWQAAVMKHDVAAIDELIADDFIGTSSTGKMGSKSTLLYELKRDQNTYTSATARGLIVRNFGGHVAVVAGTARETGTTPEGQRFTSATRFTDTWMERDGRWQCIASHATQLPKK